MADPHADAKRSVARAAAELVESGMRVGLGTGSTFTHAIDRLAERMRDEGLEFVGVPTSIATETKAREFGIPLTTLDDVDALDLTIDGADEVDGDKNLVKGGGGALLREKVVATASARVVIVATANKLVDRLGATFRLPIEVVPFGKRQVTAALRKLGLGPELRQAGPDGPFFTDNRNLILDCEMPHITDLDGLDRSIQAIPGVVESGLFLGLADAVMIGEPDGSVRTID